LKLSSSEILDLPPLCIHKHNLEKSFHRG
jgi:hypothetical protein